MGGSSTKIDWKESEVTITTPRSGTWNISATGEVRTKEKTFNLDPEKGGFRLAHRENGKLKHHLLVMIIGEGQRIDIELGALDKEKEKDRSKFNEWLRLVRDLNRLVKGKSGTQSQILNY